MATMPSNGTFAHCALSRRGCDPDKIHKLVKENKIPRDLSKHVVLLSLEGSCGPRFKMQSYHNATGALTFFYMNRWE